MILKIFAIICVYILYVLNIVNCGSVSVTIESGKVIGYKENIQGKDINIFLSIPYAQPPINELRFKKPLPSMKWTEPIDATKWPNPCIQMPIFDDFQNKNFSEDCLYLNIWSPNVDVSKEQLKPVFVWIHGGGLDFGSSNQELYSGDIFAARNDVVFVSINYRLNIFGFLYTGGNDDISGNQGLYDQALALEWINDNIAYFGGDSKQITIFGESAGSWSVGIHYLSPLSRNLYKNAMMMSGGPQTVVGSKDEVKATFLKVSKSVGCVHDDDEFTENAIKCLKEMDANTLLKHYLLNADVLGPKVLYGDDLLPHNAIDMLKSGNFKKKSQLLIGTVEDEGGCLLPLIPRVDREKYSVTDPHNITIEESINEFSKIFYYVPSLNAHDISKFYMSTVPPHDYDLIRKTIGIAFGHQILSCPTIQFGKLVYENGSKNKVFQYYWTHKIDTYKEGSYSDVCTNLCGQWMGSCHCSELWAVFGKHYKFPGKFTTYEKEIADKFIESLIYFNKYGELPKMDGAQWPCYDTINDHTLSHYYTFGKNVNDDGNFDKNLHQFECEVIFG